MMSILYFLFIYFFLFLNSFATAILERILRWRTNFLFVV